MGMFDTLFDDNTEITCPHCKKKHNIDSDSKNFNISLPKHPDKGSILVYNIIYTVDLDALNTCSSSISLLTKLNGRA